MLQEEAERKESLGVEMKLSNADCHTGQVTTDRQGVSCLDELDT